MPGFVVTAVFVLGREAAAGWKVPLGPDVLASSLGPGHRFSYCDGGTLSVVLELVAADDALAFETVLGRVERAWAGLGGGELPAPTTLRLQRTVPPDRIPAGRPGSAPRIQAARDRVLGRGRARGLVFFSPPGDPLAVEADRWAPWPWDDPDDDGGLAGVREPRRSGPDPGHLAAGCPVPGRPPLPPAPPLDPPRTPAS